MEITRANVTTRIVRGVLGGALGESAMTIVRLAARRLGLVEAMVPQSAEARVTEASGVEPPGGRIGHQATAEVLHHGYGAAFGALMALAARDPGDGVVGRGLVFGAGVWLLSMLGVVPVLGLAPPPWRARGSVNAVNGASHLIYGLATALVVAELTRQTWRPATWRKVG